MTDSEPLLAEGCVVLRGRIPMYTPPDKRRYVEQIAYVVRHEIRGTTAGNLPWPLLFAGDVGSGKTCAGLCMIDTYGGWYIALPDLLLKLTEAQCDRIPSLASVGSIWADWRKANLVVLDEIGARNQVSDHHYENLKRAIDLREGRPAVFVSNHELGELAEVYDDRIASRLAAGTQVQFVGDRRVAEGCERGA